MSSQHLCYLMAIIDNAIMLKRKKRQKAYLEVKRHDNTYARHIYFLSIFTILFSDTIRIHLVTQKAITIPSNVPITFDIFVGSLHKRNHSRIANSPTTDPQTMTGHRPIVRKLHSNTGDGELVREDPNLLVLT
jgi:hypothetical protein